MSSPISAPCCGNYISNLPLNSVSGGWNGMNAALYGELSQRLDLQYVGPVNPAPHRFERFWSQMQKALHLNRNFYFFSDWRLRAIAMAVKRVSTRNVQFDYYHGITPWIYCQAVRPTFVFADACFLTYHETYHYKERFRQTDLQRIAAKEKTWLQNVERVFFTSRYAMGECCRRYELSGDNFQCVGLGAGIPGPSQDSFGGALKLIFVAVDFERKGGDVCVRAFTLFREKYPNATLTLIGAKPPDAVLNLPGVNWAGFLSKEVPEQLQQLTSHLSSAFALVLPTVSDMTPLVVAEAALFGCPTIAPRTFGIPEMIQDGCTGRLLSAPPNAQEFAAALLQLASDDSVYRKMRTAARSFALQQFTWKQVGARIVASIAQQLANVKNSGRPAGV